MAEVGPAHPINLQLSPRVRLTETSLEFVGKPTFDEWLQVTESVQRVGNAWQWWVGDALASGEVWFGESYAQAIIAQKIGVEVETVQQAQWVAERVAPSTRVSSLSWAHHRAVASLDAEDQAELLALAAERRWSVAALRDLVTQYKANLSGGGPPKPLPQPDVPPPPSDVDDPDDGDLREELVRTLEENAELTRQLESLQTNDKDSEILRLHREISGLRARLAHAQTEAGEAVKQARWAMGQLTKIKKALGVSDTREILPAIERLVAR